MQRCHRLLAFGFALTMIAPIAHAALITATANLSGANENPVNASPGTGTTFVILDTTSHSLRVQVTFASLVAGTTAAHIHCCVVPPGNAGVATTTPYFAGFPIGVTSGSYDQTFDTTIYNASGKGTYQAGRGHTLIAYYQWSKKQQPYRQWSGVYTFPSAADTARQDDGSWIWKGEWNGSVSRLSVGR